MSYSDVEKPDYRYGCWAGNQRGHSQDPNRCVEEISDQISRSILFRQCSKKRGYGPNKLYCSVHGRQVQRRIDGVNNG